MSSITVIHAILTIQVRTCLCARANALQVYLPQCIPSASRHLKKTLCFVIRSLIVIASQKKKNDNNTITVVEIDFRSGYNRQLIDLFSPATCIGSAFESCYHKDKTKHTPGPSLKYFKNDHLLLYLPSKVRSRWTRTVGRIIQCVRVCPINQHELLTSAQ